MNTKQKLSPTRTLINNHSINQKLTQQVPKLSKNKLIISKKNPVTPPKNSSYSKKFNTVTSRKQKESTLSTRILYMEIEKDRYFIIQSKIEFKTLEMKQRRKELTWIRVFGGSKI